MKFITTFIFASFTIAMVNFSLSNSQHVSLGFWPFEQSLSLPLYLWSFFVVLASFFLGYLASLLSYGQRRNKIYLREKQAQEKEKEAKKLHQEALEITKQRNKED